MKQFVPLHLVLDFTRPPTPEAPDRVYPFEHAPHAYFELPAESRVEAWRERKRKAGKDRR